LFLNLSGRLAAYDRAITRAVAHRKATDGEAHVLDLGTGTGALALMAARAGATSVVACDLHESLCDVARKAAAANGFTKSSSSREQTISVVHKDVALLQRGHEVRPLGVNIVIADMFDAGLTGDQFPYLLDLTRKKVVQPGATVVPAAATLYCMGIEALTTEVEGVKVSGMNAYRWDSSYQAVKLNEMPHRVLTKPTRISETFFDGEKRPRPRDSLVKLDIISQGTLNAILFWFDLHLDDVESITSGKF
jgi:protein arginine N-methyltransferase 7